MLILTGGGTAGHVMPNVALLPLLRQKFDRICYFGGNGIEKKIAKQYDIPFYETTVVKLDRAHPLSNVRIPTQLTKGIREATAFFRSIRPDLVFSKGGYAALPACFAARKMRVPVVCHESDYSLGLANKITSVFAEKTLTAFPETKGGLYVGNPVRSDFFCTKAKKNTDRFRSFDPNKKTLLVCGGSLGAQAVNAVVYRSLPFLTERFNVIHIAGEKGDFSQSGKNYYQIAYADDFPSLLRSSDIVVSRSGSNTLFEIASLGKPCLTVPLPKGASRGDQILNARSFEKRGYCMVLPQNELNEKTLLSSLLQLEKTHPPKLDVADTNEKIVNILTSCL